MFESKKRKNDTELHRTCLDINPGVIRYILPRGKVSVLEMF